MIYYNSNIINDWNFGGDNIIKVYKHGAVVFYKFDGEQGGYKVCYAVVEDISQYQETEFEDVYDKTTEKWYKLNNLNQYEEYGVYGSGRSVTTYNGKITIDDGYEYEWNGSSWVNIGAVSGSSRVPIIGYTEVEYIENTSTAYINLGVSPYSVNGNSFIVESTFSSFTQSSFAYLISTEYTTSPYYGFILRWVNNNLILDGASIGIDTTATNIPNGDGTSAITFYSDSTTTSNNNTPITLFCGMNGSSPWRNGKGKCYSLKLTINNNIVRDLVPAKRDSDEKYGMYDIVNDVFYLSPNNVDFIGGDPVTPTEYPKYYSEQSDPPNNLTFNTMEEAVNYAKTNCVYDGMHAIIDGDRYYFDSSDENGWVKILEYYKFEDVTPGGPFGWTISGSSTYNPNSSYYDDFDLETNWTSNSYRIAKVTIYGYDHFTYYLRSYHPYSTSYGLVMATNVDEIQTPPSTISYNSSSAITNTYNLNKSPKSAVNLSNYRRVTYNNLDKTVEHTFYVYFYGRTYSSYVGNATILIPKEQTNENWEQVTFSASSNVASTQKNLYIDNNTSSNGGTQYWYHRWMVGLPSGSHSSYTNYSNYSYCPNVTSSTFTSVAGEQRQVNFTYDNTTNKTLSFRLTDGSNVLTPSNTVYYNMTYYNSCGVSSSSSNVTFPRSLNVIIGGRFRFANSSNRHYIYGYSPNISLNTDYYVNNYQNTFDITYTKLSDEAVTITYTTYDPSDVETPAFKTDITYPYNGGTTSSTTLTSYAVPYTYPYEVSQTNDKFSADSQSYTAGQAARTINFVLYPDNREFASVADLEAYQYAWEGMKATVGDTKYEYKNGEWVEKTSKDSDFVIGDFNTFISSSTEVTEGYYIIYSYAYDSSYANKNYLFSWNSGNTWNGYYTLGNMNHTDSDTSVPISSSEIIDDAVWEFKDAGNGNFYIRNVGTNKYWYYLGTSTGYGVPLTDNANDATPVSIQDWRSCLAFVEKQSGSNRPVNKLYGYTYRYGWYGVLASDGNNQYYMRKYVP